MIEYVSSSEPEPDIPNPSTTIARNCFRTYLPSLIGMGKEILCRNLLVGFSLHKKSLQKPFYPKNDPMVPA
jgi:hypothetical protein